MNLSDTLLDQVECSASSCFISPSKVQKELQTFNPSLKDVFSILSINIRSIRKNFNLLLLLLQSIKHKYSIITLCETWLFEGEEEMYHIPGYKMYSISRAHTNRSGGLIIYASDNLNTSPFESATFINESFDSLFIKIIIKNQEHSLGVIYRSPSVRISNFINHLDNMLLNKLPDDHTTICGDFNLNLLSPPSQTGIEFTSIINNKNLNAFITIPTRPGRINNEGTLIDHIWSTYNENVKSMVIDYPISDHFPTSAIITIPNVNSKINVSCRKFHNDRLVKFQSDFDDFVNKFHIIPDDPNANINNFLVGLTNLIKLHFPIINFNAKIKELNSPWIDKKLLKFINKKPRMFKNQKNGELDYEDYKAFRNLLNKALELSKKIYLCNKFNNCLTPKETWKAINNLKNKNSKSNNITLNINSYELILDNNTISVLFIDYFHDSIDELVENMNTDNFECLSPVNQKLFTLNPVTRDEVINAIKKMKENNKHNSEIPVILLKLIAPKLSTMLTTLFNNCIQNSVFPQQLKFGLIIPIHKKGDKKNISNYRPITLLNPIANFFESILFNRVNDFFSTNSLFVPEQYGFTKGKSIQNACLTFLHDAYQANNKKIYFASVFIDLTKAFDTINHEFLLQKLYNYGIRYENLQLFRSYLSTRSNFVQIKTAKSHVQIFPQGVPQGSSLGPLLFNIFINDITKVIKYCKIVLYADDILLYAAHENLNKLSEMLNSDLENISKYTVMNNLIINLTKTKSMLFFKNNNISLNLSLNSFQIEQVASFKYLGLILDNQLSFKQHILELNKKLNQCNRSIVI